MSSSDGSTGDSRGSTPAENGVESAIKVKSPQRTLKRVKFSFSNDEDDDLRPLAGRDRRGSNEEIYGDDVITVFDDYDEEMGRFSDTNGRAAGGVATLVRHPWLRRVPLLESLIIAFGVHAVGAVANIYFLIKGVAVFLTGSIMLPVFKDSLKLSASTYQSYTNVAQMAWACKPCIGIISDAIPLAGYNKKPYMLIAAVAGFGCCVGIAALSASKGADHNMQVAQAVTALFFILNFGCATLDLLCEGKYSELMVSRPSSGSTLVSWAWGCAMVGSVVAAVIYGPLADSSSNSIILGISGFVFLISILPIEWNWFGERIVSRRCVGPVSEAVFRQGRVTSFCLLVSFVALALAVITLFVERQLMLISTAAAVILLSATSFACLPPLIAKANLFMFLKEALYVQLPGPLDFFFTAPPSCVPNGPHFSYTYYQTFTGIVGYVAGAVGVAFFHKFFSTRQFRLVFWCTTLVKVVASLFDYVMVMRWNIKVGISDHLTYLLGDAIVFSACSMLDFMPAVVLISKLCPKGMEATMYALMAGFSNFGQTISRAIGYWLSESVLPVNLDPDAKKCEYSNLGALVLVAHCALPLAVIPLTFLLVPNSRISESLLDEQSTPTEVPPPAPGTVQATD